MGFTLFQLPVTPTPAGIDLSGKTVIVTGENAGIGYETARQFLALAASTVILAVRHAVKGEAARDKLLADAIVQKQNPKREVIVMKLDLDDYKSVIEFADCVKKKVTVLHILLLNTGIGRLNFELSASGHERATQVNFLSNAPLVFELLPLLKASAAKTGAPTRISLVSDASGEFSKEPEASILQQRRNWKL